MGLGRGRSSAFVRFVPSPLRIAKRQKCSSLGGAFKSCLRYSLISKLRATCTAVTLPWLRLLTLAPAAHKRAAHSFLSQCMAT